MTTVPGSTPITTPTFGQVGYDAYGNHPSTHGPWTTFDGRPMPKWEEYSAAGPGSAGAFTQERWEESAKAIITEHERRKRDDGAGPTRSFEKVAVVISGTAPQLQVVGVWTTHSGRGLWVVLSSETFETGPVRAGDVLDAYESWKDWAPSGRAVVVLETATGGALLEPMMAELQKEDPAMQVVMVGGCWWCGAGLECPTGCRRAPPRAVANGTAPKSLGQFKIDIDSSEAEAAMSRLESRAESFASKLERASALVDQLEPRAGIPLVDTININEGRIDPFLMGISEISGSIRDLAESVKNLQDTGGGAEVWHLVNTVAPILRDRVSVLSSSPSEPSTSA